MPGYLGILLEELFEESAKTDFRDKFGEKTLQNFDKANQRLKNNGYSTDYGQYLKMSQEEIDNLILSLYDDKKDAQRKRMIKGEDKEIRGKYNYLGEKGGYKIYQPLDVQASMDLGVNTGWCTAGRYGHEGHPDFTPSEKEATRHFDEYTEEYGVKLYYFLNPSTMYGEYAVALYPEMLDVNKEINGIYVSSTNFELFNAEDYLDYSNMYNLPLDVIPNIDIVSYKTGTVIGYPESLELLSIEEARELPKSVKKYVDWWWLQSPGVNSYLVTYVSRHGGVNDIGNYGNSSSPTVCPVLKVLNLESPNLELYEMYNVNNEYIGIYIGNNKFLYKGKAIHHRFDEESNDYEKSEIKQFLNNWLKELQSKSKDMKESLNKGNNKMTLNEYKKTRKKNLTEKLNLNMYDDCWVECCDGEPTFCYNTLKDCHNGIISSKQGDWYYGNGEVHDYTVKRWENGKLYDVDEKTNEVIYENLKEEHIADKIKAQQDKKEMTRRAIKTLRNMGGESKDLEKEFKDKYGHSIDENLRESFEKGSFVVVDNHYPDCEYQRSFNGSMIVCCTYKVIDDLGDKLLCRDPRRRYRKDTTLGELINKEDILFSSNNLSEAQSFHSNFVKNFDYDKVKSAKVNESWVKSLKEGFYPSDYDEELEYDWYDKGLTFDRDTPSKYEFDNAREAKAALSTALSHGYVDSWREGVFVYIAGRKEKRLKEDFYWDEEDSFFTRDDLDEFQAELEYELPEVVFHKTYFEPGNSLEVDWDYEGWEETTKVKVDMRRIRYPRDLIRRYAPIVIGMIKDSYEKMERELNESYLKEDWDSLRDLAEEMINYLNDNGVSWVDIYRINDDGPLSSITLEIDGDWKHDHLRANYLLNMKYGDRIKSIQDYSLEDTGSDWGKEAHVIRLK